MITSASNSIIKHIKKLQTKRAYRYDSGEFVIEGVRQVFDARTYCKQIFISEDFNVSLPEIACPVQVISSKLMADLSETHSPQGILAIAKMNIVSEEMILKDSGLYVFCDAVQDPGNLGTIIRTADSAGVDGVILSSGCVDLFNPKTVRSTMSSIFNVPVCLSADSVKTFNMFKNNRINIVGTSPRSDKLIYHENLTLPTLLVLGNEANGISDTLLTMCDSCVKIPMVGHAESLNVATAGAVLIYEAVRQRTL